MWACTCDRCKDELAEPGGLIISPPHGPWVSKRHVCVDCYTHLIDLWMET